MLLTNRQRTAYEMLQDTKVTSPIEGYRDAFEALVKKGLAIKHSNGGQVTYTLVAQKGFNESNFPAL